MGDETKVLVVDDDERNVRILEEILSDEFVLETAIEGLSALEKVSTFMPDIILLDVMMPDIGGLEVCKIIRENIEFRYIKIILVSGKAMLEERLEGFSAGADDYITKPFDHLELLAKVNVYAKLKRIEEIDQLKTDFLSLMTHETGAPLNAILGFSSLLLSEDTFGEEHKNMVRGILSAGKELLDKVDKILLWGALKKGTPCLKSEIILNDLIDTVLDEITKNTLEKDIAVDKQCTDQVKLYGNEELLKKALKNILENAFKYSPDGGSVVIEQSLSENGTFCVIKFKDSGPGFNDIFPDLLFKESRITDTENHEIGLGISLALTKLIVEMHGGRIDAKNNENRGATFTVSFPVYLEGNLSENSSEEVNK